MRQYKDLEKNYEYPFQTTELFRITEWKRVKDSICSY